MPCFFVAMLRLLERPENVFSVAERERFRDVHAAKVVKYVESVVYNAKNSSKNRCPDVINRSEIAFSNVINRSEIAFSNATNRSETSFPAPAISWKSGIFWVIGLPPTKIALPRDLTGLNHIILFELIMSGLSYDALSHHGLGNLHEACHVGTLHVVDIAVRLGAVLHAVLVDVLHDPQQLGIHLLAGP